MLKTILAATAAIAIATSAAAHADLPPCCSKPSANQDWGASAIDHRTTPGSSIAAQMHDQCSKQDERRTELERESAKLDEDDRRAHRLELLGNPQPGYRDWSINTRANLYTRWINLRQLHLDCVQFEAWYRGTPAKP